MEVEGEYSQKWNDYDAPTTKGRRAKGKGKAKQGQLSRKDKMFRSGIMKSANPVNYSGVQDAMKDMMNFENKEEEVDECDRLYNESKVYSDSIIAELDEEINRIGDGFNTTVGNITREVDELVSSSLSLVDREMEEALREADDIEYLKKGRGMLSDEEVEEFYRKIMNCFDSNLEVMVHKSLEHRRISCLKLHRILVKVRLSYRRGMVCVACYKFIEDRQNFDELVLKMFSFEGEREEILERIQQVAI